MNRITPVGGPTPTPPLIPGSADFQTATISSLQPTETVGPYTSWKLPVVAATITNSLLIGFLVDGVTLVEGDRVLVKNQFVSSDNGIYIVKGNTVVPQQWLRSDDLQVDTDASALCVFVNEGTIKVQLLLELMDLRLFQ